MNRDTVVTIAIVAPAKRGKTTLIAALRESAQAQHTELAGRVFEFGEFEAYHQLPEVDDLAMRRLDEAARSFAGDGRGGLSSDGSYNYRVGIEGPGGRRTTAVLLDVIGEALWPLDGRPPGSDTTLDYPSLRRRYDDLGLAGAEHVLVLLINEPPRRYPEWQARGAEIPEQVATYLRDVSFARVVLLVAGADCLEIAPDQLASTLAEHNRWADSTTGMTRLGDAQRRLARSFLRVLERECRVSNTEFAVFWCSAKGAGDGPRWHPIEVARPLIWAAGFSNADVGVEE